MNRIQGKGVSDESKIERIEYCDQVVDFFFDIFLKDLPTGPGKTSFGSISFNRHPGIVTNIENIIRDGVSLMALDNGNLAGILLSHTITR